MATRGESESMLHSVGESVGGFLASLPDSIGSFFAGIGAGAGVQGFFDWAGLIIGLALLLSTVKSFRAGRIVGPMLRGFVGVALMGWAVT